MDLDSYMKQCLESPVVDQRGWAKFIHQPAGLFLPTECSLTADWIGSFEENFEYVLGSSNKIIKGHLFKSPGICIVAESMWLRQSPYCGGGKNSKAILGTWDSKKHQGERSATGCTPVQKILIYFVDDQCKLLHRNPVQLTISGAFGTCFKNQYKNFCAEMCGNEHVVGTREVVLKHLNVPESSKDQYWKKYVEWMRNGKTSGPNNPAVRMYSCAFVFRPVFESSFATNSKGTRNAMRTCNTVGYAKASPSLLVSGRGELDGDYSFVQKAHFNCLKAYDHYLEKEMASESSAVDTVSASSTIVRSTVENMDETFDFE